MGELCVYYGYTVMYIIITVAIHIICLYIEMDNNSTNTLSQVVYLQSENARSSCHENEVCMYILLYYTCICVHIYDLLHKTYH